ncbi:hypothetical protein Y032_0004g1897 [Ancylostoma ceylanicum]|uniref:Uncharacterized protein n=1 Tax=Ancylostoma ceylanicum TaxID=53326 RepID=A0A016VUD9_9BILA|nr:hypothetical protein Y032_0004g1897 [Ancylostoma ceylanicum]
MKMDNWWKAVVVDGGHLAIAEADGVDMGEDHSFGCVVACCSLLEAWLQLAVNVLSQDAPKRFESLPAPKDVLESRGGAVREVPPSSYSLVRSTFDVQVCGEPYMIFVSLLREG